MYALSFLYPISINGHLFGSNTSCTIFNGRKVFQEVRDLNIVSWSENGQNVYSIVDKLKATNISHSAGDLLFQYISIGEYFTYSRNRAIILTRGVALSISLLACSFSHSSSLPISLFLCLSHGAALFKLYLFLKDLKLHGLT